MGIVSSITPNSRGEMIGTGVAAGGGAAFMIVKGGPSAHRHQFIKTLKTVQKAEFDAWLKYHDARIKPHFVLAESVELAQSKAKLVGMANAGHSPSILRMVGYGTVGAVGLGLAVAGVTNLVQSFVGNDAPSVAVAGE
jgi:hypothetical protein